LDLKQLFLAARGANPAANHRGDNPQPHGPLAAMVLGRTVLVSTPYNTASGVTFQPNPVRGVAKISSHLTPGFALQNQGNHLRLVTPQCCEFPRAAASSQHPEWPIPHKNWLGLRALCSTARLEDLSFRA